MVAQVGARSGDPSWSPWASGSPVNGDLPAPFAQRKGRARAQRVCGVCPGQGGRAAPARRGNVPRRSSVSPITSETPRPSHQAPSPPSRSVERGVGESDVELPDEAGVPASGPDAAGGLAPGLARHSLIDVYPIQAMLASINGMAK